MNESSREKRLPRALVQKSAARLAAVQALYQLGLEGDYSRAAEVVDGMRTQLEENHGAAHREEDLSITPDMGYFQQVVIGAASDMETIASLISAHLAEGWETHRLSPLLRAVLQAAIYELRAFHDLDRGIIISEYLRIADEFFEPKERNFVNALLDNVAGVVRGKKVS